MAGPAGLIPDGIDGLDAKTLEASWSTLTKCWRRLYVTRLVPGRQHIAIIGAGPSRHKLTYPLPGVDLYLAVNGAVDQLAKVPEHQRAWCFLDDPCLGMQPPPGTTIYTGGLFDQARAMFPGFNARRASDLGYDRPPGGMFWGVPGGVPWGLTTAFSIHLAYAIGARSITLHGCDWAGKYDDYHWEYERRVCAEAALILRHRGVDVARSADGDVQDLAASAPRLLRSTPPLVEEGLMRSGRRAKTVPHIVDAFLSGISSCTWTTAS